MLERQQENIKQLLKLIKENPELEILPMIDSECVPCDDYAYWAGRWGAAEVDHYIHFGERIFFKENDFDKLVDEYMENEWEHYPNSTDDELEDIAIDVVNNYAWVKAVVVKIDNL